MIHPRIQAAIDRYVRDRIKPGSFLLAVLENDLWLAVESADDESFRNLRSIVAEVYYNQPAECCGSPEKVAAWLASANPSGQATTDK